MTQIQKYIPRITLAALVVLLPLIIVSILLALIHDATLFDHAPFFSDEPYHWHQAASMATVGFDNGYYTLNENIPLAGWSHYYAWGAYTYVPYAIAMQWTGIALDTLMWTNVVLFMLGAILFIVSTRLDMIRLVALGITVATFIPLINYLPSSLLQLLQLAIALVIAAGFYHLLKRDVSWQFVVALVAFLVMAGLSRPTWTILALPAIFLAHRERNLRAAIQSIALSAVLVLMVAFLFYTSTSPFPHFRTRLFLGDATLLDKVIRFGEYIWISLGMMLEGEPLVMAQRIQFAVLIPLVLLWGAWQWRQSQHREKGAAEQHKWLWEWLFHVFNLVGFYILTILFHETLGGHDYRVMSAHLFLSLALFVAFRRWWLLGAMVVIAVLYTPALVDNYEFKAPNFAGVTQTQYERWSDVLAASPVQYDADAPNAWCNSLISSSFYVFEGQGETGLLLAIDAGIGLSWMFDWDSEGRFSTPDTLQSRYVMLTDIDVDSWASGYNLRELVRVQDGAIYENLDSACFVTDE